MASADGAREEADLSRLPEASDGAEASPLTGTWPHSLSHEPLLRVSDVLAAVGSEFPTLTPSKLRFLDTQGLVRPQRTGGGYRHYSPADVERLRFVLRQQRDHYQPLTVIAERLGALDRGEAHEGVFPREVGRGETPWLAADHLAARAGVGIETVAILVSEGILQEGLPGLYARSDIDVVRAAGEYLTAGGDLRALRAVWRSALREADSLRAEVAPLRAKGDREEAQEVFRIRAEASTRLFAAVLASETCD